MPSSLIPLKNKFDNVNALSKIESHVFIFKKNFFHTIFRKLVYDKEEKKRVALTKSKKKKAEETTMFEKRIKKHPIIDGMLCRHCVASVTEALESLDGVTAKVNLKKQSATVTLTHPIADDTLIKVVTDAGFGVTNIA